MAEDPAAADQAAAAPAPAAVVDASVAQPEHAVAPAPSESVVLPAAEPASVSSASAPASDPAPYQPPMFTSAPGADPAATAASPAAAPPTAAATTGVDTAVVPSEAKTAATVAAVPEPPRAQSFFERQGTNRRIGVGGTRVAVPNSAVLVQGIPSDSKEEMLYNVFGRIAKVQAVQMLGNQRAIVRYTTRDEARIAIEQLSGSVVGTATLHCEYAAVTAGAGDGGPADPDAPLDLTDRPSWDDDPANDLATMDIRALGGQSVKAIKALLGPTNVTRIEPGASFARVQFRSRKIAKAFLADAETKLADIAQGAEVKTTWCRSNMTKSSLMFLATVQIRDLSEDPGPDKLRESYCKYGEIIDQKLSGRSFLVQFSKPAEAYAAIDDPEPPLGEEAVVLAVINNVHHETKEPISLGGGRAGGASAAEGVSRWRSYAGGDGADAAAKQQVSEVKIGNLPYDVTETFLRGVLSSYGRVVKLSMRRGYCTVTMVVEDKARMLRDLDGQSLRGRRVRMDIIDSNSAKDVVVVHMAPGVFSDLRAAAYRFVRHFGPVRRIKKVAAGSLAMQMVDPAHAEASVAMPLADGKAAAGFGAEDRHAPQRVELASCVVTQGLAKVPFAEEDPHTVSIVGLPFAASTTELMHKLFERTGVSCLELNIARTTTAVSVVAAMASREDLLKVISLPLTDLPGQAAALTAEFPVTPRAPDLCTLAMYGLPSKNKHLLQGRLGSDVESIEFQPLQSRFRNNAEPQLSAFVQYRTLAAAERVLDGATEVPFDLFDSLSCNIFWAKRNNRAPPGAVSAAPAAPAADASAAATQPQASAMSAAAVPISLVADHPRAPGADAADSATTADIATRAAPPARSSLPAPAGSSKCVSCAASIGAGFKFCPSCGAKQPFPCRKCGVLCDQSFAFCPSCGTSAPATASAAVPATAAVGAAATAAAAAAVAPESEPTGIENQPKPSNGQLVEVVSQGGRDARIVIDWEKARVFRNDVLPCREMVADWLVLQLDQALGEEAVTQTQVWRQEGRPEHRSRDQRKHRDYFLVAQLKTPALALSATKLSHQSWRLSKTNLDESVEGLCTVDTQLPRAGSPLYRSAVASRLEAAIPGARAIVGSVTVLVADPQLPCAISTQGMATMAISERDHSSAPCMPFRLASGGSTALVATAPGPGTSWTPSPGALLMQQIVEVRPPSRSEVILAPRYGMRGEEITKLAADLAALGVNGQVCRVGVSIAIDELLPLSQKPGSPINPKRPVYVFSRKSHGNFPPGFTKLVRGHPVYPSLDAAMPAITQFASGYVEIRNHREDDVVTASATAADVPAVAAPAPAATEAAASTLAAEAAAPKVAAPEAAPGVATPAPAVPEAAASVAASPEAAASVAASPEAAASVAASPEAAPPEAAPPEAAPPVAAAPAPAASVAASPEAAPPVAAPPVAAPPVAAAPAPATTEAAAPAPAVPQQQSLPIGTGVPSLPDADALLPQWGSSHRPGVRPNPKGHRVRPAPRSREALSTILIEYIPPRLFNNFHVGDFFSRFGKVVAIELDTSWHGNNRAFVRYSDPMEAQAALTSTVAALNVPGVDVSSSDFNISIGAPRK